MNKNGWCPLFSQGDEYETRCRADECAFWDKDENDCVLFSLKKAINKITDNQNYNLRDVCSKVDDVYSEINDVDSKLGNIQALVEDIDIGISEE